MAEIRLINNRYSIRRLIGHGGMGSVYEAYHHGLEALHALKQLQKRFADNPDIEKRFRGEAKKLAKLKHPNIVQVYNIDADEDFGTYLAMELIDGLDLREVLKQRNRLPYLEVLEIGLQLAAALGHAHRQLRPIIHRDIKPANILIEKDTARAVLTDFGIAKELQLEGEASATVTDGTEGFIGTYRYSSPEQIRNEKNAQVDVRSDVYSLGVVLYEMYAGRRLLEGASDLEVAHRVAFRGDWEPARDLEYAEPPPELFRQLLLSCVTRERADRIKSAQQLIERLGACLEEWRGVTLARRIAGDSDSKATLFTRSGVGGVPTEEPSAVPSEMTTQAPVVLLGPDPDEEATRLTRQLRQRLDQDRPDVEARLGELRGLVTELRAFDEVPPDLDLIPEAKDLLEGAEQAHVRPELESALATTERLNERISATRARVEQALREGSTNRLETVRADAQALVEASGELLEPGDAQAIFALLDEAAAARDREAWAACRNTLDRARETQQRTRARG